MMLVLTRSEGERVLVGDNIWITVVQTKGSQVSLAFDAPSDVGIWREELWLRDKKLSSLADAKDKTGKGNDKRRSATVSPASVTS